MTDNSKVRAIGSKHEIYDKNDPLAQDFLVCISDLLENERVQRMKNYYQHMNTSRFQHCLSVSYYSYLIARRIGADPRKAARAGLLHDLFLYDWREKMTPRRHTFVHPKAAAANAKKVTELSEQELDAILKHMWPLCSGRPVYRESVAVTVADKYAASIEVMCQWGKAFKRRLRSARG
ncbi:MAG: HD domain-containing protein [Firmicutes bacterium]|nr:HD domain-containing protein [Bacillota bacterium]MBQ9604183.1 HD domain-containing protein [Bacillota bacterium]